MKKEYYKIDKNKFKLIIDIFGILILLIFLLVIFGELFIPIVINIIQQLLGLVTIWVNSPDRYIRFFGGMIFLFISWKIFSILGSLWFRALEVGAIELDKVLKKIKGRKTK